MTGAAANTLQLYKATVANYLLAIEGGTSSANVSGSKTLNLNQGDTVTIRSVGGVTLLASAVNNVLTINSVG
jgi:hypothetical protein